MNIDVTKFLKTPWDENFMKFQFCIVELLGLIYPSRTMCYEKDLRTHGFGHSGWKLLNMDWTWIELKTFGFLIYTYLKVVGSIPAFKSDLNFCY